MAQVFLTCANIPLPSPTKPAAPTMKIAPQINRIAKPQGKMTRKAFDALDEWMSDFIAIARVALDNEPQLLEMLEIVKS